VGTDLIYDNANGAAAALGVAIEFADWINLEVGYWATNPVVNKTIMRFV
jgi:hypothetical protein